MATSAWGGSWGEAPDGLWGDSWGFEGFTAPVVDTGPPPGGGISYLAWWQREWERIRGERKKKKKKLPPRKTALVDKLDDAALELRAQLAERQETDKYAKEIRAAVLEAELLLNQAVEAQVSDARLRLEIARLEEYMREMDDEETIILALH